MCLKKKKKKTNSQQIHIPIIFALAFKNIHLCEIPDRLCKRCTVLALAGIALMFFTVAAMGLSFGYVLKTVLVTQRCFHYF